MKKIRTNFKKMLLLSGLGFAALSAVAIIVSCGESDETPSPTSTYRAKAVDALTKATFFAPDADSLNTKAQALPSDPAIKSYKFLTGDYPDLATVKKVPLTSWQDAIPRTIPFTKSARYLWIKIIPRTLLELQTPTTITEADLATFKDDNQYVDATFFSKIRDVKSNIAQLDTFKSLSLDNITVEGTLDNPSLNLQGKSAPDGTEFVFLINNTIVKSSDLVGYIKTNKQSLSAAIFANAKVALRVTDAKLFALTEQKEAPLRSLIVFVSSVDTLVDALKLVAFDSASDHAHVKWLNLAGVNASKPVSVQAIEYYAGTEATETALRANTTATWTSTLPTVLSATHTERHLWARFIPTVGAVVNREYVDLTMSTRVQEIKTLITPAVTDLSVMSLGGTLAATTISNLVTAPDHAKVQFKIKTEWVDASNVVNYLRTNATTITYQDLKALKAHYVVDNAALYILSGAYESAIASTIEFAYEPSTTFRTSLENLKVISTSNSEAVSWDKITELASALPAEVSAVNYYYGEAATIDELLAITPAVTWSAALPNKVNAAQAKRNLFAKLVPAPNVVIANPIINLTTSSNIRTVKTLITTTSLPLGTISYKIRNGATIDKAGITLPNNTILKFQFNDDSTWRTEAEFITYVAALNPSTALSAYQNVKVRLDVENSNYVIDTPRESLILFNSESYRDNLAKLINADIYFAPTSVSSKVTMKPDFRRDDVAKEYQYLVGNYSSLALAKAAPVTSWSTTLPQTVDFTKSARYMWVKVVPYAVNELPAQSAIRQVDIDSFSGDNQYIGVTSGSLIQAIKSDIAQTSGFSSLSLAGVSLTGTMLAPVLNIPTLALPSGTKLVYSINNTTQASSESLTTYLTTNKLSLTKAQVAALKVKLALDEGQDVNFVLNDFKEAAVNIRLTSYRTTLLKALGDNTYFSVSTSTSLNVATSAVGLDPIAKSYQYLSGEFTSLETAKAAPATAWSDSLPTTVLYEKLKRNLWVKVTPRAVSELTTPTTISQIDLEDITGDNTYFEITTASNVRGIKSNVAQQANFSNYALTGVTLGGTLDQPVVSVGTLQPLPETQFAYVINNTTMTNTELVNYIKNNKATLTSAILSNIKIKLIVSDSNNFVLSVAKEAVISSSIRIPIKTVAEWDATYPQFAGAIKGTVLGDITGDWTSEDRQKFQNAVYPSGFTIPNFITEIAGYMFEGSTFPVGFSIPDSVKIIGLNAFLSCKFAEDFKIPAQTTDVSEPFRGVEFSSNSVIPTGLTYIPDGIFNFADLKEGFSLPSSITKIGTESFKNCTLPSTFILGPNIVEIGQEAFVSATLPTGFAIPSGVTSLPAYCFYKATLPNDFTVPATVTSIDPTAFSGAKHADGRSFVLPVR